MIRIGSWSCVGVVLCVAAASPAYAQLTAKPKVQPPRSIIVSTKQSELYGVVQDERGQPIDGAVVSAVGSTSVFAVSDHDGRFAFRSLPPGPYLVRAHLPQYLPVRGHVVQVNADGRTRTTIALMHRSDATDPPSILAAVEQWVQRGDMKGQQAV